MALTKMAAISMDRDCLDCVEIPRPSPTAREVLVKVSCCGVCHTEMDEIEGRLAPSELPRILGHQVVGCIESVGAEVTSLHVGQRVGIAWIFDSCGHCQYCQSGDDNLCPDFKATGKDAHGGYAEYLVVPEQCAFLLPDAIGDIQAAPLLCAGAIGYRSLRLTGIKDGQVLGMTGFGASAHLMMKMIKHLYPHSPVFVFARQAEEREYALSLGAAWTGSTDETPPSLCDAIVDTTPAWWPVVKAMEFLAPGGRLVVNAIRKEKDDLDSLLQLEYETHLWQEKELKSVANVSRRDVREFLDLARQLNIQPEIKTYPLEQANEAIKDMKFSAVRGAKVLIC